MRQVLRGAAGVIIVRDEEEAALALPRTYGVDDIPLVFQWKTFDDARQIVESDEQDNEVLVNGVLKGSVLNLPAQIVRLRLLNGSSHRYFDFGFSNNASFKQIGGDAGLLDGPVSMTRLIIAPGERAEILVDLNGKEGQDLSLKQFGTQLPQGYPGGTMMMGGMMGPLDNTDFELVKIHVTAPSANAVTSVPSFLTTNTAYPQAGAGVRTFGMTAQPMMSMTNFFINGLKYDMETINFSTQLGKTEVWTLTNMTMMAHPFHVHGNSFYVLSVNGVAPPANMRGRKDVITVPPMQGQVNIIIRFENFSDPEMPYMYHCHILSHEDTGMMGQFLVTDPSSDTKESQNDSSCPICTNFVALPAGLDFSTIASVDIYHQDGRLALSRSEIRSETTGVDISTLPTGVYLMKLSNATHQTVAVRRFFKK
jgi:bilirubin oxidase